MKLKPKKPLKSFNREEAQKARESKKRSDENTTKKKKSNKLGSDEYKDLVEPLEMGINDNYKLIFSVKRAGEFGVPTVDIRKYSTTELYTGFTKQGIMIPLDLFIEIFGDECDEIIQRCEDAGVEPESELAEEPEDE